MGARTKHHPVQGNKLEPRQCLRAGPWAGNKQPYAPASSGGPDNSAVDNPFGPQSQWSSLLCEREYLQDEILRGERYLHQIRGEVASGWTLMEVAATGQSETM